MAAEDLFVLVGMPAAFHAGLGEERRARLAAAHPRAEVAIVADAPDQFSALLPRADAALIWPSFAPRLVPALQPGSRLRWVQSLPAGVDGLLTPELLAA